MDFKRLSSNIIDIIDGALSNQQLVNYIGHNGNDPSLQTINPSLIAPKGSEERIFPYPFDTSYEGEVKSQLHIYYPQFKLKNNGNANQVALIFDIVVHKSLWLVTDNGEKLIRPYQIAKCIVDSFADKRIGKLGKIHFVDGSHTIINSDFEGLRLIAQFTEF